VRIPTDRHGPTDGEATFCSVVRLCYKRAPRARAPQTVPVPVIKNPIFCALDRPDLEGALALARAVAPHVGGVKLGLEFFAAQGPRGVEAVRAAASLPVFLDLKLHDIPNTVAGAVRAAAGLGVAMLTLHAAGGRAMLEAAAEAAAGASTRPLLLGVTVLTSLDGADLAATGVTAPLADHALELGRLAVAAGLDGLVCSAQEIAGLRRALGAGPKLVVPGIRPESAGDDQKRTMVPAEALALGADVLVIGRPITRAGSPAAAAAAIAGRLCKAA
jgi:orotidine-5'-phosphate decarboxylase